VAEAELHYYCRPTRTHDVAAPVEFLALAEFLADEPSCKVFWDLVSTQFKTRSKFLAVWSGVRHVAVHRNSTGLGDGFLLVNAPLNWQIDYVVVHPNARGQGIASALVRATVNQAHLLRVPYVMLTSKESVRQLYEACGFEVIGRSELIG